MNTEVRPRPFLRLRGRSFMAVVLMPELPLEAWLEQLDGQLSRAPKFFEGRAVLLDFTGLQGLERSFPELIEASSRIMTLEQGDVFATGTPAGVWPIVPGDVLEAEISRVGTLRCNVASRNR